MSQNENLQCSEKNEVIIINTKEETLDTKVVVAKDIFESEWTHMGNMWWNSQWKLYPLHWLP